MKTLLFHLKKALLTTTIGVIVIPVMLSPFTALAIEFHEDPEQAEVIFDGISLFRYYSASLDLLLRKEPAEVEARLGKMPFANIPEALTRPTVDFAASSTNLSYQVFDVSNNITRLGILVEQSRFDEAATLAKKTVATLVDAEIRLNEVEQALLTIGRGLRISSASPTSDLSISYGEVTSRIEKIRAVLAASKEMIAKMSAGQFLKRPQITLKIAPFTAFVGDSITFEGDLASEGQPLAGREITILLDGSQNATARTDPAGHFGGTLAVPYIYPPQLELPALKRSKSGSALKALFQPEVELQSLYAPKEGDAGLYSAVVSPVIKLNLLFYEAQLKLTLPEKSYPGLETSISGRFDYRQAPVPAQRNIEIYLDDVLVATVAADQTFTAKVRIPPDTLTGKHRVTLSAIPRQRYSPVTVSATLNITKSIPTVLMKLPKVVIIPGNLRLQGNLSSEIGALEGASIKLRFGGSETEVTSSTEGSFDARVPMGMGSGLAGWQQLEWEIIPQEPWHAPAKITSNLFTINMVTGGGSIIVLALLGIYLPSLLRKRFALGMRPARKTQRKQTPVPQTAAAPGRVALPSQYEAGDGSRSKILDWYRLLLRLLERLAKTALAPQQTLREFAVQYSKAFGPFGKPFMDFSRLAERLLYSRHEPTPDEVKKSSQITQDIREAFKGEGI